MTFALLALIVAVFTLACWAVTTTTFGTPLAAKLVVDSDCDSTAENDVFVGAVTIRLVDVDNSNNAAVTYVKLWNALSPTVGTTAPDMILMCPASVRRVFAFPDGISFGTGLSFAGLTTAGTAGTTSPTSNVTVKILGE